MGITIHYQLAQKKHFIKNSLDDAKKYAELLKEHEAKLLKIPFEIRRLSETKLLIDIGGCETLSFDFNPLSYWKKKSESGWNYEWASLEKLQTLDTDENDEHYKNYPEQILLWSANFCKTQFGQTIEHKWIAGILKSLASKMEVAIINDESDYYYTNNLKLAEKSKEEIRKIMGEVKGVLIDAGFDEKNIIENQTIKTNEVQDENS